MINIKICNMSNLEKSFDIDDRKPFSQRNMSTKFVKYSNLLATKNSLDIFVIK